MTHLSLPRRAQRSRRQPDPYLADLLQELAQLQLHGRVLITDIAGEDDVRLQAWWDSGHRAAELLWCSSGKALPGRLEAVRLIGGERSVWRSAGSPGCPATVVRFVRDLLLLDDAPLLRRYQRLG